MKKILLIILLSLFPLGMKSQNYSRPGDIDIFMGVDFNCRDIYFNNRVYDVLVNLTPGIRWNIGHRWQASLQMYIPVLNQYGDYYKRIRPRVASVSRQFAIGSKWKMKISGGIFTADSYGFDVKNMFVINKWFALSAQVGLTGYLSMADGWHASTMDKITFMAGPDFYLSRWNTQFALRGGRYLFNDYGVEAEVFRHFRHVSVGAFVSYNNIGKEDAGFKVIVMLPPYKRKNRKVNFRLADDFRLKYNVEATNQGMRRYSTDPEENERQGWFDHDLIPWGTDLMESDFNYKEDKKSEKGKEEKR